MNILCRKNELGKLLNFMSQKFPEDFEFYPKTWVFPRDQRHFENHLQSIKEKEEEDERFQGVTKTTEKIPPQNDEVHDKKHG